MPSQRTGISLVTHYLYMQVLDPPVSPHTPPRPRHRDLLTPTEALTQGPAYTHYGPEMRILTRRLRPVCFSTTPDYNFFNVPPGDGSVGGGVVTMASITSPLAPTPTLFRASTKCTLRSPFTRRWKPPASVACW